jgi:hypothetical protein
MSKRDTCSAKYGLLPIKTGRIGALIEPVTDLDDRNCTEGIKFAAVTSY